MEYDEYNDDIQEVEEDEDKKEVVIEVEEVPMSALDAKLDEAEESPDQVEDEVEVEEGEAEAEKPKPRKSKK